MATIAHKILSINDRALKERLRMAEIYSRRFVWEGDFYATTFEDGSVLAFVLDSDLQPMEIVEI